MQEKTPLELASIIAGAQYIRGKENGILEAARFVDRAAGDAFRSHDDLIAQRLRSVADNLTSQAKALRVCWRTTHQKGEEEAFDLLRSLSESTPALTAWLDILSRQANQEEE
jgi:hypothetical protein